MTERHTNNTPANLGVTDARAGKSGVGLRWVLGVSLVAAVLAFAITYMGFFSA